MLRHDQKLFVGRAYEQKQYRKLLAGEEKWIVFFTGNPGIGKTRLLLQLKEENTPPDVGVIFFDFQRSNFDPALLTDPLQVLKGLADAASCFCEPDRYQAFLDTLQREREQLEETHKQITQKIEELGKQISDAEQLDWITERIRSVVEEQRQDVLMVVTGAFYDLFDTFQRRQLVLMLDTCERLLESEQLLGQAGAGVSRWLMGVLLPGVHDRMWQWDVKCLVVIGSRERLESEVLQEREQVRFDLGLFTREEVKEYLDQVGIGADIDDARVLWFYEKSGGHPLTLKMMCEDWRAEDENLTSEENQESAAFQGMIDDRVTKEFIEERILKRLPSPFKELTEFAVVLRSFNLEDLQLLFPEWLPEAEAEEIFHRFIRYSYIEALGGYRYTFHVFIREPLATYTKERYPQAWKDYHKRALELFPLNSPEWYYHWIAAHEMEGIQEWQKALQQARRAGRNDLEKALLQIASDERLVLPPEAQRLLDEQKQADKKESGRAEEEVAVSSIEPEPITQGPETAREEIEIPQVGEDEDLLQESTSTKEEMVPGKGSREVLIPSPLLISLLIVVLAVLLILLLILLFHI